MKRNNRITDKASERVAGKIAATILWCQAVAALKLNAIANRYSRKNQKCALIIFCSVIAAILVIQILLPCGRFLSSATYSKANDIGLPSSMPLKPDPIKRTNSLTLKK